MPRALTKADYENAIDYFREHPGDAAGCARHMGWHYRTARKMWKQDSKLWPWMKSIERVLSEEAELEMTAEEEREAEERAVAKEEADKARRIEEQAKAFEDKALEVARVDILHGLVAVNQLTKGITKLAKQVNEELERGMGPDGKPLKADVHKCLNIIRSYTTSTKGLIQATESLVNLGRVQRDLPTTIIGLEARSVTVEDARKDVELAQRALRRAEALGLTSGAVLDTEGESVGE